jgi:hypothetical protein
LILEKCMTGQRDILNQTVMYWVCQVNSVIATSKMTNTASLWCWKTLTLTSLAKKKMTITTQNKIYTSCKSIQKFIDEFLVYINMYHRLHRLCTYDW